MEHVWHLPRSISKLHKNILPINAFGSWLTNYNEENYLDLTSGIGALSTGHSHPKIIKEVSKQLGQYVHIPQQVFQSHPIQVKLNKKMISIMPNNTLDSFFYTNSGSEAVDNALKLAKKFTNKQNIIALNKGFHGRTIGALSVTSSNLSCRKGTFPLMTGIFTCQEPTVECLNNLFDFHISPKDTAAIIIEPVQGEGGIHSITKEFLEYVRKICSNHNIILIIDEVQSGSGRTGTWWNIEQKHVEPDLLLFGKGIASGFPFAGIAGKSEIMDCGENLLGGTYGGNAICSAAACASIDVINDEDLLKNTVDIGNYLKTELIKNTYVKEVRQYGLMIAIEFKKEYSLLSARNVVQDLNDLNILTLLCGNKNQYIRLLPSLNLTLKDAKFFIMTFNNVMAFYKKYDTKKDTTLSII